MSYTRRRLAGSHRVQFCLLHSFHKFSWLSKQRAKTRFKQVHERDLAMVESGTHSKKKEWEKQCKTNMFAKEQLDVCVDFSPNSVRPNRARWRHRQTTSSNYIITSASSGGKGFPTLLSYPKASLSIGLSCSQPLLPKSSSYHAC